MKEVKKRRDWSKDTHFEAQRQRKDAAARETGLVGALSEEEVSKWFCGGLVRGPVRKPRLLEKVREINRDPIPNYATASNTQQEALKGGEAPEQSSFQRKPHQNGWVLGTTHGATFVEKTTRTLHQQLTRRRDASEKMAANCRYTTAADATARPNALVAEPASTAILKNRSQSAGKAAGKIAPPHRHTHSRQLHFR